MVRATSMADIQEDMVRSEKGVQIAELQAHAAVKHASGESKALQLRSVAEAEAIRSKGNAKAEAYRAGVEALGVEEYTAVQLMQIVSNGGSGSGMADGLMAMLLRNQLPASNKQNNEIVS